jgi:hypothetical protein
MLARLRIVLSQEGGCFVDGGVHTLKMPENSGPNALKIPENTAAPTKHPAKTHLWEVFMPSPHPHDTYKSPKWKIVDRLYLS